MQAHGCYTHFGLLSPKTRESYFVHMMYVEFMKNFLLAHSCKYIAVRPISASRNHFAFLNPRMCESYFLEMMYVEFMKNFLLPDSSRLMVVSFISAS